jgi:hypothetical protein
MELYIPCVESVTLFQLVKQNDQQKKNYILYYKITVLWQWGVCLELVIMLYANGVGLITYPIKPKIISETGSIPVYCSNKQGY